MYRYISLVWNEADRQATETAKFLREYFAGTETPWEPAYDGRGLLVLHTGEEKNRMQAYPLPTQEEGSGGVVLGKLFKRERDPASISKNAELDMGEAREIIRSEGRRLVDDYWGTWVAFFQEGPRKYVQVDPVGIFSCFSTPYRGVEIYFTYLPDVASCKFLNFSVEWPVLAKYLIHSIDRTQVPIKEIIKVLPGQRLIITSAEVKNTFLWDPQKISQTDVIEDMDEAALTLRQTILSTVASMAAPYDNVINLTGGLDSSILLASLGQVPTPLEFTCFNLYEDSPCADERYFVRQAAAHVGVPLIEYRKEIHELNFEHISAIPITTRPTDYTFIPERNKFLFETLLRQGAQAMFSGRGGDEILYVSGKNFAPIDYIKRHGIRPPLLRIMMEASRMQNRSVWTTLPEILRRGVGRDSFRQVSILPTNLLTDDIMDMIPEETVVHPWLKFKDGITPGKVDHIEPLVYGQYNRDEAVTPDNFYETLYPYLSQPVIEACLRIPLWLMMAHGKNRGLARKAFKNYLPVEVIWRGAKSVGSDFLWNFALKNLDVFNTILMDGELAQANIIDRQNLGKALSRYQDIEETDFSKIHAYLNAELWLRKVKGETFSSSVRFDVG